MHVDQYLHIYIYIYVCMYVPAFSCDRDMYLWLNYII